MIIMHMEKMYMFAKSTINVCSHLVPKHGSQVPFSLQNFDFLNAHTKI